MVNVVKYPLHGSFGHVSLLESIQFESKSILRPNMASPLYKLTTSIFKRTPPFTIYSIPEVHNIHENDLSSDSLKITGWCSTPNFLLICSSLSTAQTRMLSFPSPQRRSFRNFFPSSSFVGRQPVAFSSCLFLMASNSNQQKSNGKKRYAREN